MEPKFRSIPLTIIDFMAIFLPGVVWLWLGVTLVHLFSVDSLLCGAISPTLGVHDLIHFAKSSDSPVAAMIFLGVVAILSGYVLRPIAMGLANYASCPAFALWSWRQRLRYPKEAVTGAQTAGERGRNEGTTPTGAKAGKFILYNSYPFNTVMGARFWEFFDLIKKTAVCTLDMGANSKGCEKLQHWPFCVLKRYIRLVAADAWEECERGEAEVRMLGALLLAASVSLILSFVLIAVRLVVENVTGALDILPWLLANLLVYGLLAEGFRHTRFSEVEHLYINVLVVNKVRKMSPERDTALLPRSVRFPAPPPTP